MKLFLFLILLFSSVSKLNSQVFYLKINNKFLSQKIECFPITSTKLKLKVHYESSLKCACEEFEEFEVETNNEGKFVYEIYDQTKIIVVINNNSSVPELIRVVNNDYFGSCCSVVPGLYFQKKKK
jgi:hypothetical protein